MEKNIRNSLLEKIDACQNNSETSSTAKVNKQNTCGYSLFKNCPFGTNKIKHDYYRGDDCMKNFFKDLSKHKKIINCEKLKVLPFTDKQNELYTKQKSCYICRKKISSSNKKYDIVPNQYHYRGKFRDAAHNICNLRCKTLNGIPVIKMLAKEF